MDADNICPKPIIDALKGEILPDDTPEYVEEVRLCSRRGETDRVVIGIIGVNPEPDDTV